MSKKTKPRSKRGRKHPKKRFIIRCEGKTEHAYFEEFRQHIKGKGLKIINKLPFGFNNPRRCTRIISDEIKNLNMSIHRVFYVFDADKNSKEDLEYLKKKLGGEIEICFSNPCFELWYLLHYKLSLGSNLSCSEINEELKDHIKNYEKGGNYFSILLEKKDEAVKNAKRLDKEYKEFLSMESNPSTRLFKLIEEIESITDAK